MAAGFLTRALIRLSPALTCATGSHPSDSADSSEKVIAAITLSKDGKVISSRITKPSGNADLNKSVQDALNKVTYVAPFPDSEKDAEKTFHLEFDPKAKRMMG